MLYYYPMSSNSQRVMASRRRLKVKAVAYLGGSCIRCGYNKCIDALEFHHRDPSVKDFQIAGGGNYRSLENLKAELDKCDLLCANCHREVHSEQRQGNPTKRGRQHVQWPTFEELSRLVWSKPILVIASDLRVSRYTIRYWVRALGVQPPPIGHWLKLHNKSKPSRKPRTLWPIKEVLERMLRGRPATSVAKDLGVSSVAVKKRCKKLGINPPTRGYWAKVYAGKL